MQALPMITPNVVRNARTLLAQRASSATIQVSLRGIMTIPVDENNFPEQSPALSPTPLLASLLYFFYFFCTRFSSSSTPLLCGSSESERRYSSAASENRPCDSYSLPSHSSARACGGRSEFSGTVAT